MDKETKNIRETDRKITAIDLASVGEGEIAYIKVLTSEEAGEMFPSVKGIPEGISLYSLHGADGRAIALTDSRQAAIGHAREDDLQVASLH